MDKIKISNGLSIKKLEPDNEKDLSLLEELNKDEMVTGENGYLYSLHPNLVFRDLRYLYRSDIYDAQFSIYHLEEVIGYLDISDVFPSIFGNYVSLSYAILERFRRLGYMSELLSNLSDIILQDRVENVDFVSLVIDNMNIPSSKLALKAGFTSIQVEEEYKVYSKRK